MPSTTYSDSRPSTSVETRRWYSPRASAGGVTAPPDSGSSTGSGTPSGRSQTRNRGRSAHLPGVWVTLSGIRSPAVHTSESYWTASSSTSAATGSRRAPLVRSYTSNRYRGSSRFT
ncbi:hypothetical protein [Streptomyces cellostaticus]|nr:hypothetical protein [Streptomyces cellostaticus]